MYDRILVPLDGSKLSESSLKHVKTFAAGFRETEIVLLTVIDSLTAELSEALYGASLGEVSKLTQKERDKVRQKAEDYLSTVADGLRKEGLVVTTVVPESESIQGAAQTIIDYAKDNKIDLIIVSSHGRSGISRWTLGSVADKLVRHAGIPVLTIVPEELRS
jgi:nucleotide-binding universal stress UspA family protein